MTDWLNETNKFNGHFACAGDKSCDSCKRLAAELADAFKRGQEEMRERATLAIRNVQFRCHAEDDIDFRSGCIQTQESILVAVRALPISSEIKS